MARWEARTSERLRSDEEIEASVPVGDNGLVVTSQRVFAFTPEHDGANFRSVERPNVERVSADATSEPAWLGYVARAGLAGIAGTVLGLTVDFGGLFDLGDLGKQSAGQVGMRGVLAVLQQVSRMLELLDEALLVGGLLALALALGTFGKFLESRTKTVRIRVAGDADLYVPAADRGDTVAQLRRHLAGDGASPPPVDTRAQSQAAPTESRAADAEPAEESPTDRGTIGTVLDSLQADSELSNERVDEE